MGYAILNSFATKEEAIAFDEGFKQGLEFCNQSTEDITIIFNEENYLGKEKPWSVNLK